MINEPITACEGFVPIKYSRKDTPETISQILGHNAAYTALCPDESNSQK